jgi:mono/diheme cytochrome c family protein
MNRAPSSGSIMVDLCAHLGKTIRAGIIPLAVTACGGGHVPLPTLSSATIGDTTGLVMRGEYLVRYVANCGHCHAADPKQDIDGPLSGGMEFKNWRLGTIRASNITPDSATGIGAWSDAEIVRAIRNGEDRDGEVLAPVMPYAWFNGMSDRDALAIVRYLRTLTPVRNLVKSDHNLAYRIGEWFFLKPMKERAVNEPTRAAHAEYGRYLVHHVALCADCHTPRGGLQAAPRFDLLLAGEPDPPKGFPANPANLTPDSATGIGKWTEEDFLRTLETGDDPAGEELHEFMPWRQFRRMSDDDLRAIYRYLRTVKPIRQQIPD